MNIARLKPHYFFLYVPRLSCGMVGNCRRNSQNAASRPYPKVHDMVGPPDPKSNLRQMAFARRKNETPREQGFRMKKEVIYSWHQEFWTKHNENYNQSKKAFLERRRQKTDKQFADELSVFYKAFLDKHYQLHKQYQWDWYKNNFRLTWPALRVALDRFAKYIFSRNPK